MEFEVQSFGYVDVYGCTADESARPRTRCLDKRWPGAAPQRLSTYLRRHARRLAAIGIGVAGNFRRERIQLRGADADNSGTWQDRSAIRAIPSRTAGPRHADSISAQHRRTARHDHSAFARRTVASQRQEKPRTDCATAGCPASLFSVARTR